jgi:hypothetical protein
VNEKPGHVVMCREGAIAEVVNLPLKGTDRRRGNALRAFVPGNEILHTGGLDVSCSLGHVCPLHVDFGIVETGCPHPVDTVVVR